MHAYRKTERKGQGRPDQNVRDVTNGILGTPSKLGIGGGEIFYYCVLLCMYNLKSMETRYGQVDTAAL